MTCLEIIFFLVALDASDIHKRTESKFSSKNACRVIISDLIPWLRQKHVTFQDMIGSLFSIVPKILVFTFLISSSVMMIVFCGTSRREMHAKE